MKFKILFVFVLLALLFSYSPGAVDIGTDVEFIVGNETYVVNQTMKFSEIEIADTWIEFNNTVKIRVHSTNNINITLVYLRSSITGVAVDTKLLEFYANTTAGNVWFNISGFTDGTSYTVNRNDTLHASVTGNATQNISFNNSDWSQRLFTIYSASSGSTPYGGGDVSLVRESYFTGWTKEGKARIAYIFTGDIVKSITGYRTVILTSEGSIDGLKNFLK